MKNSFFATLILLLAFQLASPSVFAQQDPLFTYYTSNSTLVNPAIAGSNKTLHMMVVHRSQWMGFNGAPTSSVFAFSTPLYQKGLGVGASFIDDRIGYVQQMSYFMDLSYRMVLKKKLTKSINYMKSGRKTLLRTQKKREDVYLSFGLKAGVDNFRILKSRVKTSHTGDNSIAGMVNDEKQANFGFGLYLYSPSYFITFSIPRLVTRKVYEKELMLEKTDYRRMHFYLGGGIVRQLSPYFKVRPTIMTRYVYGNPLSVDMSLNFLYQEKVWMGLGYRLKDAMFFNLEYYITDTFRISYSYDLTTTSLNKFSYGTHEVSLNIDLRLKRTPGFCKRYY